MVQMKKFRVTNIDWETDGEKVELPKHAIIEAEDEEVVVDRLSDRFGYLINSVGDIEQMH